MVTNKLVQQLPSTFGNSVLIRLRIGLVRVLLFMLIWYILTGGAIGSWLVGIPIVILAAFASVALLPPIGVSPSRIIRFLPFFIWHSLRGGIDVAKRALHPQMAISPAFFDYRFGLPPGVSRVFMANVVSLLPGTLSAELHQDILCVHVLDETGAFVEELNVLEKQVAGVFGLTTTNKLEM
jgi:multicomponent Na+:H+ antiporter subunit E